jgi:outer membrane lipoprotein SlyB
MRTLTMGLLTLLLLGSAESVVAQTDSARAAECTTYARNQAEMQVSTGRSALGGAVGGAAGGALFGAIIGGGKGAGRGAALGGGLGAIGGGIRAGDVRQDRYQQYYNSCMSGAR